MNDRLRQIKEEEERNRRRSTRMNRASLIVLIVGFLAVFFLIKSPVSKKEPDPASAASGLGSLSSSQATPAPSSKPSPKPVARELILVNKRQRMPDSYTLDLQAFGEEQVDSSLVGPLTQMIEEAAEQGISLLVISGYRDFVTQAVLYQDKIAEYRKEGLSEEASVVSAGKYVQPPRASEHHTGLAVDILTEEHTVLDEAFGTTPAYEWLRENAPRFGFIERYAKGKESVTEVNWEPWHFRYVGPEAAQEMAAEGLVLEEYREKLLKQQ